MLVPEGVQPAGEGITAVLGTTERDDGTYQVTANGMPLYYYANDAVPGDTKGQGSTGAGALWYVLNPSGEQITTMPTAASFSFFVSSAGSGKGADLGGLAGADALCQSLAAAVGAGNKTWRAYLSTAGPQGVNARDRIGTGPWHNVKGVMIASDIENLHGENNISNQTALDEKGNIVNGRGDTPNKHDILTGSDTEGRVISGISDSTCSNWTSSADGNAMVGHHDRIGLRDDEPSRSWNSSHFTRGCSQEGLISTGGDGLIYCFALN